MSQATPLTRGSRATTFIIDLERVLGRVAPLTLPSFDTRVTNASLTGRSEGYRGVAIRCPGCGDPMRQVALTEANAEVDVCSSCQGLWIDWFDGELRAIATETLRVESEGGEEASIKEPRRPSRNEPAAVGACPRCSRQLITERYSLPKPKAEPTEDKAPETDCVLLRCEECMGSFVSRPSAEVLSWLADESASDEPPPSRAEATLRPLPWDRFIALIKRLLGMEAGSSTGA